MTSSIEVDSAPGQRRVIAMLEREGFEVVDAQDGQGPDESPYLAIWSEPAHLVLDTLRVVMALERYGIACVSRMTMGSDAIPNIEGRFNPLDDTAIIDVWNVHDRMLPPEPN